jgi:hypothetical protein
VHKFLIAGFLISRISNLAAESLRVPGFEDEDEAPHEWRISSMRRPQHYLNQSWESVP